MTYKRIESLVPPGTPIDEAREIMEVHGFVCTFEESVGIPYLQCNQITRQHLWPFNGIWMATLYFEYGLVTAVQARYDLNPVERGTRIPKRSSRKAKRIDEAKDAKAEMMPPGIPLMPGDEEILQVAPGEVPPADPSASTAEPPATVPLDAA